MLGVYSCVPLPFYALTPIFIAVLFAIAKTQKQPKCPLRDERIRKDTVYIHSGVLLSHQRSWKSRKEILPFSTNGWALSTFCWDKSDKVKQVYCMMSFASQVVQVVKNLPVMQETQVQSLGWGDPPEMATPSRILTWRIWWKEGPVGLKSMGLQLDITEWLIHTCTHSHKHKMSLTWDIKNQT